MRSGQTGFSDHTQNEAGTEKVQPRDQEVSKKRIDNIKRETNIKTHTKGQGLKCQKNTKISIVTNLSL